MKIIDISVKLQEGMLIYEGDPAFCVKKHLELEKDGCNVSSIHMGSHTGTHIDALCHYIADGVSAGELPLELFIGECAVSREIIPHRRLLLKDSTRRELTAYEAKNLISMGVRLVGTENLTVGGEDVHKLLLGAGVVILENIDLSEACEGIYTLISQPLRIYADGSPVRACLIEVENE